MYASAIYIYILCCELIPTQDIWHNFHGGVGKQFVASAVAELAPCISQGTSLESRIEVLKKSFSEWKRMPGGMRLHYGRLDRETFGLTSLQVSPWSKFNDMIRECC